MLLLQAGPGCVGADQLLSASPYFMLLPHRIFLSLHLSCVTSLSAHHCLYCIILLNYL